MVVAFIDSNHQCGGLLMWSTKTTVTEDRTIKRKRASEKEKGDKSVTVVAALGVGPLCSCHCSYFTYRWLTLFHALWSIGLPFIVHPLIIFFNSNYFWSFLFGVILSSSCPGLCGLNLIRELLQIPDRITYIISMHCISPTKCSLTVFNSLHWICCVINLYHFMTDDLCYFLNMHSIF